MEIHCKLSVDQGISSVRFNQFEPSIIGASTWGGTVESFDSSSGTRLQNLKFPCPQLCCTWTDESTVASGGLDGNVSLNGVTIGSHNKAVSAAATVNRSIFATGSWDGSIKVWDSRSREMVFEFPTSTKIYTVCAANDSMIIAGGAERGVYILDTRRFDEPQSRHSSVNYQTRAIAASSSEYAIGTVEGRVSIEPINQENNPFAFKAHIQGDSGKHVVYPVNDLAFSPKSNNLATAGSDGFVYVWDTFLKRKVQTFGQFPTSVASISYNKTGTELAIAVSYCFEFGEQAHPPDDLIIHKL